MRRHGAGVVPRTEADGDFVGGVDGLGGGDVDLVVFDVPEGDSAGHRGWLLWREFAASEVSTLLSGDEGGPDRGHCLEVPTGGCSLIIQRLARSSL